MHEIFYILFLYKVWGLTANQCMVCTHSTSQFGPATPPGSWVVVVTIVDKATLGLIKSPTFTSFPKENLGFPQEETHTPLCQALPVVHPQAPTTWCPALPRCSSSQPLQSKNPASWALKMPNASHPHFPHSGNSVSPPAPIHLWASILGSPR